MNSLGFLGACSGMLTVATRSGPQPAAQPARRKARRRLPRLF